VVEALVQQLPVLLQTVDRFEHQIAPRWLHSTIFQ